MSLIESLAAIFDRPADDPAPAPEGLCPNCWGRQEYDDQIRELARDKQVDV